MFGRSRRAGRGRFERRAEARARRIQKRLEEVTRARAGGARTGSMRAPAPVLRPPLSRPARVALFASSLLLGTLLAGAVTTRVLGWLRDEPAGLGAIAVQGAVRLGSDEIATATGLRRGDPLDAVDEAELEQRIASHPWIRSARVALLPTGTLIVEVEEREARAVVRDVAQPGAADGVWHFVDRDAVAFAAVRPGDEALAASLPALVRLAPSPEADAAADPNLVNALALAAHLESLSLPGFSSPGTAHRGIELQLPDPGSERGFVLRSLGSGAEVILGSDEIASVNDRLDRLEHLLGADLADLEVAASIDMRFAGQAVLRTASTSR